MISPQDLEARRQKVRSEFAAQSATPGPTPLANEAVPKGPLPQFDAMRTRVQQRSQAEVQGQQDKMKRRLAATGALSSGGGIKALQNVGEAGARATEDALQGVDAQEAQQRTALEESTANRNFQRDTFNAEAQFKDRMLKADNFAKFQGLEAQLDQIDLSQLQFKLQQEESGFNRRLAKWQAGNTGGLLGGGGFLGTGIGNSSFKG